MLLFLMDGLHEDLNRIRKRPKLPELDTNNLPDNSAAEKAWIMHKKINDSVIVDLFQVSYAQDRPVELRPVASCTFSKRLLRKICSMSSCLYGGEQHQVIGSNL